MKSFPFAGQLALMLIAPALCLAVRADSGGNEAVSLVDSHAIEFTAPASRIPSDKMVDGPLLGNGDLGVTVAGAPEALRFHIGKNDFWGQRTQSPQTVGRIEVLAPALSGAPYHAVCDMRRARWMGSFAKGSAALAFSAFVDANANQLFIELENKGSTPLDLGIRSIKGMGGGGTAVPTKLQDNDNPALIGCEQHGGGRWFFKGTMADITMEARAASDADVSAMAKRAHGKVEAFDGQTRQKLDPPALPAAFTISGWIQPAAFGEANYILSKGDWDQSYSLGLSTGHLRFAVNGTYIQTDSELPGNAWTHIAAVYDGKRMELFLDGRRVKQIGAVENAGPAFLYAPDGSGDGMRKVAVATRIIGQEKDAFTLSPGKKAMVVSAVLSDLDARDPLTEARARVAAMTQIRAADCAQAHEAWWASFWKKSFIEIPDKVIEEHWYSAQYILGSCSRAGKVAPGLWGNWITTDHTAWHGDFHLNYNFQAPFYSVFSANRPELALPFFEAMNQSIPRGQRIAAAHGWKGIHLPVSIGPWGMCPEGDGSDWGQRSNAAYSALLYGWYWRSTRDTDWLRKTGYPYMREVAAFWTDYLKLEDGRYVIHNDAIHEGHSPTDVNPIFSLGAVRALFGNMVDMSEALGEDASLRPKWKDILEKLSPFPTQERGGKTVFRYTEKGTAWWGDNTVGIQHIYPAGAIGLGSDPKLLEISRNMIDAMGRWSDNNGASSWYAACARVGYDPSRTLTELRHMYDKHSMLNKIPWFGGGGIENASPAAAVDEMLLQSHEDVIRLFPSWPKNLDARFGSLRADGAFLVSAELKGGVVSGVTIQSEKGRDFAIVNPWPGHSVKVVRNGNLTETASGPRFTLKTSPGDKLKLVEAE